MKLLNQKWMQKLQYYTNYMYKGKVIIITNITHIKFIKVLDKLYRVTDISLLDMSISASECKNPASAAAKDVFLMEELLEFHITLYNKHEKSNITDFSEWKKQHNYQ